MGQIPFSSPSIPVKSVFDWPVTNSVAGVGGATGWVDGSSKGGGKQRVFDAFLTRFLTHLGLLLLSFCGLSSFLSHLANMSSQAPSLLDLMSWPALGKGYAKGDRSCLRPPIQVGWTYVHHLPEDCKQAWWNLVDMEIWTELRQVGNLSKKAWLALLYSR